jgi:hypothetical protein
MTLLRQLEEMHALLDRADLRDPKISGWSVGQHIEHCCLTIRSVAVGIGRTSRERSSSDLTIAGLIIMDTGRIPRGTAEAPKSVVAEPSLSIGQLERSIDRVRVAVGELDPSSGMGYFDHPYLGRLDPGRAVRFLEIHNEHHLAIARETVDSASG